MQTGAGTHLYFPPACLGWRSKLCKQQENRFVLEISISEPLKLRVVTLKDGSWSRRSPPGGWPGQGPDRRVVFHCLSTRKFSQGFINASSISVPIRVQRVRVFRSGSVILGLAGSRCVSCELCRAGGERARASCSSLDEPTDNPLAESSLLGFSSIHCATLPVNRPRAWPAGSFFVLMFHGCVCGLWQELREGRGGGAGRWGGPAAVASRCLGRRVAPQA